MSWETKSYVRCDGCRQVIAEPTTKRPYEAPRLSVRLGQIVVDIDVCSRCAESMTVALVLAFARAAAEAGGAT